MLQAVFASVFAQMIASMTSETCVQDSKRFCCVRCGSGNSGWPPVEKGTSNNDQPGLASALSIKRLMLSRKSELKSTRYNSSTETILLW